MIKSSLAKNLKMFKAEKHFFFQELHKIYLFPEQWELWLDFHNQITGGQFVVVSFIIFMI